MSIAQMDDLGARMRDEAEALEELNEHHRWEAVQGAIGPAAMLLREGATEIERLTANYDATIRELFKATADNERLQAYAAHERSLGAEGPMIKLVEAEQEIARLIARVEVFRPLAAENDKLQADNERLRAEHVAAHRVSCDTIRCLEAEIERLKTELQFREPEAGIVVMLRAEIERLTAERNRILNAFWIPPTTADNERLRAELAVLSDNWTHAWAGDTRAQTIKNVEARARAALDGKDKAMITRIKDTTHIHTFDPDENIVDILIFKDRLIVATNKHVYRMVEVWDSNERALKAVLEPVPLYKEESEDVSEKGADAQ